MALHACVSCTPHLRPKATQIVQTRANRPTGLPSPMRAGPGGGAPRPRPGPPGARAAVQRRFPGDSDDGGAPGAAADPSATLAAVRDGIGTGLEWGLECLADPSDLVFDWIAGTCVAPPHRDGMKPAALLARVVHHDDDTPRAAAGAEEPETANDGPRVRERPGACAAGRELRSVWS